MTTAAKHTADLIDLGFSLGHAERLTESQKTPHGPVSIYGEFSSEYAAKFAREAYLERFMPEGYGTVLTQQFRNGKHIVSGARLASCE